MDAADDLLHSTLTPQRITPRKITYISCSSNSRGRGNGFAGRNSEPLHMISPTRPAPPPPGPSRRPQHICDENHRTVRDEDGEAERTLDPASKIWDKIRRASGLSMNHHRRNVSTSTSASVAASVTFPCSAAYGADSRALRRKKPGLVDGGGLLMQKQRLAAMGSKQSLTDRTNLSIAEDTDKRRSPKDNGKSRRASGRWNFGNWWLNG